MGLGLERVGQIGNGQESENEPLPVTVEGLSEVVSVAAAGSTRLPCTLMER